MLVSVAPVFWELTLFGTPLRLYIWYLPLIFYWVGRALRPDISASDLAAQESEKAGSSQAKVP